MTHEEYEEKLKVVLEGGENAPDTAKEILEGIDADAKSSSDNLNTAKAQYDELNSKYEETSKAYNELKVKSFMQEKGEPEEAGPTIEEQAEDVIKQIINPPKEKED